MKMSRKTYDKKVKDIKKVALAFARAQYGILPGDKVPARLQGRIKSLAAALAQDDTNF